MISHPGQLIFLSLARMDQWPQILNGKTVRDVKPNFYGLIPMESKFRKQNQGDDDSGWKTTSHFFKYTQKKNCYQLFKFFRC